MYGSIHRGGWRVSIFIAHHPSRHTTFVLLVIALHKPHTRTFTQCESSIIAKQTDSHSLTMIRSRRLAGLSALTMLTKGFDWFAAPTTLSRPLSSAPPIHCKRGEYSVNHPHHSPSNTHLLVRRLSHGIPTARLQSALMHQHPPPRHHHHRFVHHLHLCREQ